MNVAAATSAQPMIVVAMSGGVDSSVAALLLHQQGYTAVGISMQVWDYRSNGGCQSRATCCSPDDFTDARRVAAHVGIPYYVFDFEEHFRREVIDKFVRTYERGQTPNPCIDCNSKVKFKELRARAASLGCTAVATGHYAQIERRADGYHLLRGVDEDKDQSYFLYNLTQQELSQTLFPVGHMRKDEVRRIAEEAQLATANKPESQDICFVSGSVQDFLVRLGGKRRGGKIVSLDGKELGTHDGIHNFTVGQRRGLGVGGNEDPLYVIELDTANDRVVVGKREALERTTFEIGEVSWVAPQSLQRLSGQAQPETFECRAQLRHRHKAVRVSVKVDSDGNVSACFLEDWTPVSPGQAAVFYDLENRELLGGGRVQARPQA